MRRTKMVLAVAGLMIAMFVVLAAPAIANDNDRDNNHKNNDNDKNNHHNRFFDHDDDDDDDIDDDVRLVFRDGFFDDDFRHNRFFDRDNDFDFDNDLDQDADSGDVDQSFVVTNTGDNSNQCANVQGVANTGNTQNQLGVSQFGDGFGRFDGDHRDRFFRDFDFDGFDDDFDFRDSGASIEVSPSNSASCDQQVDQAATASG
jgi:hypothetical protein